MNKLTAANVNLSRRKFLIGGFMAAVAALLAVDVANLKQGDDPMTAITTSAAMAQTQSGRTRIKR